MPTELTAGSGPVIGAREAALGVLALVICGLLVRLARPMLRYRHARLVGATPEDALLQAGLGQQTASPPAESGEPAVAVTVLPSSQDSDPVALELGEQDLALVDVLGQDHPMSAPGRHRTAAARPSGGEPAEALDADALLASPVETLEPVEPVEAPADHEESRTGDTSEAPEAPEAPEIPETSETPEGSEVPEPVESVEPVESAGLPAADEPARNDVSLTMSRRPVAESNDMDGAAGSSRAGDFYGVDWHDEEWRGIDLTGRSDAGSDGEGTTGEWWLEQRGGPVTVADVVQPAACDDAEGDVAADAEPEDDSTASWWESVARSDLAIPVAAQFAESEDRFDQVDQIDQIDQIDQGAGSADGAVPTPRASGYLTAAQRDALRTAHGRLRAAADRIAIARIVAEESWVLVGADSVALIVPTPDGPRTLALHPAASMTWGPQTLAALVSVGGPLRAVLDGDPLAEGGSTAVLAVPIASAGVRVGTLVARRVTPRAFGAVEESLLDRLARIAGHALDRLTRRGMLRREEGITDPVTDLPPQSRLVQDLQAALRTQNEHGMPLSLVVAEVEGLPRMRTEVGEEPADETLAQVANIVIDGLRVGDVPYRFGDDVLAVLLAGTDPDVATAVAQRLTAAVSDLVGVEVAQTYDLTHPLRLRAVVIPVTGTAQRVVNEAERALTVQRVQARWT